MRLLESKGIIPRFLAYARQWEDEMIINKRSFIPELMVFLGMILMVGGGCRTQQVNHEDPAAAAAEFASGHWVDAWVSLWNSYDLTQVDKLFLKSSQLTYFSSEKEGIIRGIEAVREHHRGFGFVDGGKTQENKLWVEDVQTDVFGKTAVVTGIWFFQRSSGEIQRGPLTIVYVQAGVEYRIAHMHFANYLKKE
jgi:hypothetical protein